MSDPSLSISPAALGMAAGMVTSLCWTGTTVLFTEAARRLGPTVVNIGRLVLAVVLLGVTHRLIAGTWIPDAGSQQVWLLAASGLIGLTIGDQALFIAFLDVGPRMGSLLMTTAPIVAAMLGWIVLGESLGVVAMMGMSMTIGGVAWVVVERPKTEIGEHPPHRVRGIVLGLIAAACQATGLLLSKAGMGHEWLPEAERMEPLAATFVRMSFALLSMLPLYPLLRMRERAATPTRSSTTDAAGASERRRRLRAGVTFVIVGSAIGPFLGVWMSLVAADNAPVGIAQTMLSLPPVLLLPIAHFIYRESIGPRAIGGAVLAVAGVAVLALHAG